MIVNANSILQHVIQIKNGIMKHTNASLKIILRAKKDFSWNLSTYVCENSKYLKSIVDDSKITYNEIIYVMDIVSTNVSTNSDDKKVI